MKHLNVELFTDESNYAVLKLPHRGFPGVLFQGDSLAALCADIESALYMAREGEDELLDQLEGISEHLRAILARYEEALHSHGLKLPYVSPQTFPGSRKPQK